MVLFGCSCDSLVIATWLIDENSVSSLNRNHSQSLGILSALVSYQLVVTAILEIRHVALMINCHNSCYGKKSDRTYSTSQTLALRMLFLLLCHNIINDMKRCHYWYDNAVHLRKSAILKKHLLRMRFQTETLREKSFFAINC